MMKTDKRIAGAIAAVAVIATPLIATFEGKRNDPYKDIAGVSTVCYGETNVHMRTYTDKECLKMLDESISKYSRPVLESTPILIDKPRAAAAATSLAYNIGLSAYNGSTVRKKFLSGDIRGACNGFTAWSKARVNGKLVTVKGLLNRRNAERDLCLKDA